MSNIAQAQSEKTAIVIGASETEAMRNAGGKSVMCNFDAVSILEGYGKDCLATRDSDLTAMLRELFYEGALRDGCRVSLDEAKQLLTLDSSKHKTSKAKRDPEHDRVYSLAKYNWSVACDEVGLPKGGRGNARGSDARGAQAKDAPITVEAFHVPRGLDTAAAVDLFDQLQTVMHRALTSDKIKGDAGSILRQCEMDVAKYIKDAKVKLEADKPVLSPEDIMRAKIMEELAAKGAFKAKFKLEA